MTSETIIGCAYPFGYGPVAKLLHIAEPLRRAGRRLVFLGTGVAHELASRSPVFAEVIDGAPGDEIGRAAIGSSAGVLSLMDREAAAVAGELGRPCFVADSLLWMRDRVPPAFRSARRFWAQAFVGVSDRLAEVGPHATVVGPIVSRETPAAGRRRDRLVVHLGGAESPLGSADDDPSYFDLVMRGLEASGVAGARTDTVVLAGDKCVRQLRARHGGGRIEMVSAAHREALALLAGARWVVTSPGLTATLECFRLGVPTFFLPPQNYSQWWILKALRGRQLAPGSLHWDDVPPRSPIVERMPEAVRGPLVRDTIRRLASDGASQRRLADGLAAGLDGDGAALAARQRAFFDSLGPDGGEQIAHDLHQMC